MDSPSPLTTPATTPAPAIPMTALLGWIIPGAGYWLLGERVRAIVVNIAVLAVFAMGVLLGGLRVVDAPTSFGTSALLQKPWFIGQILAGPVSVVAAIGAGHIDSAHGSHGRSWEIGTLYTAVAGMLNLLALIDATHRASQPVDPTQRNTSQGNAGTGNAGQGDAA